MGALDLLPLFVGLRTDNAQKTGEPSLLLGQNHSSQLLQEMERGNLETLILLDHLYSSEKSIHWLPYKHCLVLW